jgi:hypothetical protein
MFIDPQSDVYAQYLQRKGDQNYPYRVNWEFQEQMRQHLLTTHAPDIINTTAFMNAPPSQFPQWQSPEVAQRHAMSGTADTENPYYREGQHFEEEPDEEPQGEPEEEIEYRDAEGNVIDPSTLTDEDKAKAKDSEEHQKEEMIVDEHGNEIDPTTLTDEERDQLKEAPPENVGEEVETQHNSEPPPTLSLEQPPPPQASEPPPPQKSEQEEMVDTQYNVPPATATTTQVPATSTQTSTETPQKQTWSEWAAEKANAVKNRITGHS